MKIIYKKGNLLDCREKIIMHGCNMAGVMGKGVALAIRTKYPYAFQVYKNAHQKGELSLGSITCAYFEDKMVINAITQEFYGNDKSKVYVSYWAVRMAMQNVNKLFFLAPAVPSSLVVMGVDYGNAIAMPRIGAGLAGGDWNIIAGIIEEESINFQPVVYEL